MNSTSGLSQKVLKKTYKPLFQFFTEGIKDLYWAEKAIEALLKKNKSLAYTEELSDALENHEHQTQKQILRLEKIFYGLNMTPEGKKCEAIAGIVKETEETISETPPNSMTRDAVIIIMSQKAEHYEIASYGGLLQIALTFNMGSIATLLEKTLLEEEQADLILSDIAESFINIEAAEEDDDEENNRTHSKGEQKHKSVSPSNPRKAEAVK